MDSGRDRDLRFARRIYLPRVIGLGCGFVAVAAVLAETGAGSLAWGLLLLHTFVWPHLAWQIARRSAAPRRAEWRNLVADSAFGVAWLPVMEFNVLPSVLLVAMLCMDKLSAGGPRLLVYGLAAKAGSLGVVSVLLGLPFQPQTSMSVVYACLPLLVVYPAMVSLASYRLARRVSRQNRLLQEISRTDGLTRLANRGHWEEVVAAEFQRQRRSGHPVTLLMIDIDHFKRINDRHGHRTGDEVLRRVAQALRDNLRAQDMPGRYGGEEFGVVLPDTGLDGAFVIAERVRNAMESMIIEPRLGLRCTVSIGIASLERGIDDYSAWIERADRALYAAKTRGRNCSVRYAGTFGPDGTGAEGTDRAAA